MPVNHFELHEQAVKICRDYARVETRLILILQEIDREKTFKKLGHPSLFVYTVNALGLSKAVAYAFISVSRKASEVTALQTALAHGTLNFTRACRIISALTNANAEGLIQFAKTHSIGEIEEEVARIKPRRKKGDKAKVLNEEYVHMETSILKKTHAKLKRVQALLASRGVTAPGFAQAIDASLDEFLKRHDPVQKAERAQKRAAAKRPSAIAESLCENRVERPKRVPLTAAEKHAVFSRDGGRCTHIDARGQRCNADRYLHVHHIKFVSHGGSNDPANLTSLCSFHHDLVHQLSFPIEGQVSWVRDRVVGYLL